MINHAWNTQFPNTEVCFKNEGYFDHCPGIIFVYPHLAVGKKPFKFFPMWQDAPQYKDIVQQAWNMTVHGTPMYQVVQKLKNVKIALKKLNKEGFGDIEAMEAKTAHALQVLQDELHLNPADIEVANKEKQAQQEYLVAHKAMLSFLAHKAKSMWLKEGDENTAMFHRSIRKRQIQNTILSIKDMHGNWTTDPGQVPAVFQEYYEWLLGTKGNDRTSVKQVVVKKGPLVSADMAIMFSHSFSKEDIKVAIWDIDGGKAPGPDGFGSSFFKGVWSEVGDGVCKVVLDFLNTEVISQNQGAFVHSRFIAHNTMVRQDLVKGYERKINSAGCLIKLDLQKAYDSVE
ncbi:uncharacterized protein [Spinacia oleracea]|uniref:Reverse transcriptase domain-containing protein n=1 Tax=Spinacia oleracea TaxID=3562 RepID=A0ABM3R8R9_SPIOL|nr:uncharacterized protein LOC130467509 [Spinacia oleracea]